MIVSFIVTAPEAKQGAHSVKLPIVMGRGEGVKFRIPHDKVSRRHCEFSSQDGTVYVEDLKSTNGTFLNDEQVSPGIKKAVASGDSVRVGSLTVRVEYNVSTTERTTEIHRKHLDLGEVAVGVLRAAEGQDEAIGPFEDLQVEHAEESAEAIVEVLAEPVEELPEDSEDSPEAAAQFPVDESEQAVEQFPEETPEPVVSAKPLAPAKVTVAPAKGTAAPAKGTAAPAKGTAAPAKGKPKGKQQEPSPGFDFLSGDGDAPVPAAEDDKLDDFFKGLS